MGKRLVTYMIIAATAAIILTLYSCKNDISVVNSLTVKSKSPTETATKMHLYFSEAGMVKNEFIFEEMNKYNDPEPYLEYPKGVNIISYDENKNEEMSLTANYGISYEERNIMEVKYNVVVTNFKTGEIIETEHLVWDKEKHLIYSNTQTKQTKSDGSVYIGERFESDEQLSKYMIFNPQIVFYAEE
ncbi:MAG: LPS export ABC transporter periplasmic protein LptC [Bacteroidales bacterium]|jgi:LPS export ABC transporter protein LptC|nr:LPS export ABC transporter periplasmic protein LptC [Bacteroidales bacterium]